MPLVLAIFQLFFALSCSTGLRPNEGTDVWVVQKEPAQQPSPPMPAIPSPP